MAQKWRKSVLFHSNSYGYLTEIKKKIYETKSFIGHSAFYTHEKSHGMDAIGMSDDMR
jgi:hypothetical protein